MNLEIDLPVMDDDAFYTTYGSDLDIGNSGVPMVRSEYDYGVHTTFFYHGQDFESAKHVKERLREHSIETRRELLFLKNDKQIIRVRCVGCVPLSGPSESVGLGICPVRGPLTRRGLNVLIVGKNDPSQILYPWLLFVGRDGEKGPWTVRKYNDQHTCLQSRAPKHFDINFISKQITEQIQTNPWIPVKSVHNQLTNQFELEVSMQKVLRAKRIAVRGIVGECKLQFTMLRDYVQELQKRNSNTTVLMNVERPGDDTLPTREFKRMYVCLGALKEGFKACQRQLLRIDAFPIDGPLKGQLLTVVGIDSNNGIYPLAYAFAELENIGSWTWFLHCLSDDLELEPNSIFTFVSDMQKDIIAALREVFPNAEHRFCLRSIHENMKLQWKGRAFKDHLWRCATTSTVVQFEKAMVAFKIFSQPNHAWLSKIPPIHWSRSHFSWRPHFDVLFNNMCQVFHGKIIEGINKPIITSLEYIREYCMKRIMYVVMVIEKSNGPLTPIAQHMLDGIKKEDVKYNVLWNGGDKFQVSGPWGDQCVVNVVDKSCTCRRWEITGLQCKHVVATNWNMTLNGQQVGAVETWAHPYYYLNTWEAA